MHHIWEQMSCETCAFSSGLFPHVWFCLKWVVSTSTVWQSITTLLFVRNASHFQLVVHRRESAGLYTSKAMPCRYNSLYFALCYLWVSWGCNSDNPCAFYTTRHILFLLAATWVEIILLQLISNLCFLFFFQAARGKHFYEKEELDDFFSVYIYIFFLNFYINHFSNSGRAFHTMTTEVNVLNSCLV